ncbi:hypothetical protein VNO77_17660 [Canavalia gladiata]|uniref:Uncharacterized protein n=1 Tax=Canavalia gladiata TaxID=3824 RepID=A0AAN9QJK0_CANGL
MVDMCDLQQQQQPMIWLRFISHTSGIKKKWGGLMTRCGRYLIMAYGNNKNNTLASEEVNQKWNLTEERRVAGHGSPLMNGISRRFSGLRQKEGIFEIWKSDFSITLLSNVNMVLRHYNSLFALVGIIPLTALEYTLPLFAYKSLLFEGILFPLRSCNQRINHQHIA